MPKHLTYLLRQVIREMTKMCCMLPRHQRNVSSHFQKAIMCCSKTRLCCSSFGKSMSVYQFRFFLTLNMSWGENFCSRNRTRETTRETELNL